MKQHTAAVTAVLTGFGMHAPVHAAEPYTLDPIIVTATRLDPDTVQLPAHVSIITAEEIAQSPAKTTPELLALEAGVLTRSLYGNQAARAVVDLRGFGAAATQNTLILLDGRRLNDVDLAAVDFAAIPLANIARIEIIRGGGAALYGDAAVGGVINIVTRPPGRSEGRVSAGAASYDTRRFDAAIAGGDVLSFNAAASRTISDGYRENNDLDQRSVQTGIGGTAGPGEWLLRAGWDEQSLRLPGVRRVDPTAGIDQLATDRRGTATPNDFAQQRGWFLNAGYTQPVAQDIEAVFDAGYRFKNQQAFFDDYAFGGAFSSWLDSDLATLSLTPRLRAAHGLLGRPAATIGGIDYYRSRYDSERALNPAADPAHRLAIDQTSLAVYAQTTVTVREPTHVTAGARLQRVEQRARDRLDPSAPGAAFDSEAADLDTADTEPMFDLGVRQQLGAAWSVFAHAGRSARFATVDELYEFDPSFVRVFSPLAPQVAHSVDLGAGYAQGGSRFVASVYRMRLRDEIHFDPASFTNVNLDPTRREGITVEAGKRLAEAVRVQADYAYTRATFREGPFAGNDVPLVPRHTAAATLFWDIGPRAVLSGSLRHVGEKHFDNDQSNTFEKIPDYEMLDLKLTLWRGRWRLEGAIYNALDEEVFDYGVRSLGTPGAYTAYPLPGRNYALSIAADF